MLSAACMAWNCSLWCRCKAMRTSRVMRSMPLMAKLMNTGMAVSMESRNSCAQMGSASSMPSSMTTTVILPWNCSFSPSLAGTWRVLLITCTCSLVAFCKALAHSSPRSQVVTKRIISSSHSDSEIFQVVLPDFAVKRGFAHSQLFCRFELIAFELAQRVKNGLSLQLRDGDDCGLAHICRRLVPHCILQRRWQIGRVNERP